MAEKFVTFDEAAKELKKTPDELKALVDEGKIRSFMDGGKMKFRRKDFDDLKASLGIVSEDDDLSLAPPDEVPAVPPMATEGVPPAPAAPKKAASLEDEFTIEPIDEERLLWRRPAKRPRRPRNRPPSRREAKRMRWRRSRTSRSARTSRKKGRR